ncbi:MAG: Dam family site-specific DNA-(adenine-N6)-methyltransferase [Candidatus Bilamarchaeaceae archaeon]
MFDYLYILKINGSKRKIIDDIIDILPDNYRELTWVEPFLGSGVVLLNVQPNKAICGDINEVIIEIFSKLNSKEFDLNVFEERLRYHMHMLLKDKDVYYYHVRENFNRSRNIYDFIFLNKFSYNGVIRFNSNGDFNVPFGKRYCYNVDDCVKIMSDKYRYVMEIMSKKDWRFYTQDWLKTVSNIDKNDDVIIYLDPPYNDRNNNYYDRWDKKQDDILVDFINNTDKKFILSTWATDNQKDNEIIQRMRDFNIRYVDHRYNVGPKRHNRYHVREVLIYNF